MRIKEKSYHKSAFISFRPRALTLMSKPAPCTNRIVVFNREMGIVEVLPCEWPDGWEPSQWRDPAKYHGHCQKPIQHSLASTHKDMREAGFKCCPCGIDISEDPPF